MKFNSAPRNTNHRVHSVYYILYSNLLTRSIIVILTKIARVVSHIFSLSLYLYLSLSIYLRSCAALLCNDPDARERRYTSTLIYIGLCFTLDFL